MASVVEIRIVPRWLHAWAVLTAAATLALLALGAVVTTFKVGMADPVWPTVPWHLALIDWSEPNPGFVIEHTHRLAGYVVGCCTIVLAGGLLAAARRPWLRWLGVAALAGVIVQGLLGGFRVVLNARFGVGLSVVHGCFGQVVFSLLVTLAVVTAARADGEGPSPESLRRLRRGSLALTGLVFLQLVWGALVRHTNGPSAQRLHFLTAFAVVAVAVWLVRSALASPAARRLLGRTLTVLAVLLVVQLMLGVESWLGKYAGVVLPEMHKPTVGQAATRVAHVLVGASILATSVVLAVRAYRPAAELAEEPAMNHRPVPGLSAIPNVVHHLEGTA